MGHSDDPLQISVPIGQLMEAISDTEFLSSKYRESSEKTQDSWLLKLRHAGFVESVDIAVVVVGDENGVSKDQSRESSLRSCRYF